MAAPWYAQGVESLGSPEITYWVDWNISGRKNMYANNDKKKKKTQDEWSAGIKLEGCEGGRRSPELSDQGLGGGGGWRGGRGSRHRDRAGQGGSPQATGAGGWDSEPRLEWRQRGRVQRSRGAGVFVQSLWESSAVACPGPVLKHGLIWFWTSVGESTRQFQCSRGDRPRVGDGRGGRCLAGGVEGRPKTGQGHRGGHRGFLSGSGSPQLQGRSTWGSFQTPAAQATPQAN